MKYDLFISYCRRDNDPDWLSGFKTELEARHRAFTGRELAVFFDRHEIQTGDQWRQRILVALRDSAYMLAVISPSYFASDYCRWEFEEFASREFERFAVGEAIGPIYWIEALGFPDEPGDEWQADLARRNILPPIPMRRWQDGLEGDLRLLDVAKKLHGDHANGIVRTVEERVRRRDAAERSPTNLDNAVSPNFVGRSRELVKVHESLTAGAVGAITSVQGIGGIGKTELAFAYATAYAHEYPGGRWLVPCEGRTDVRETLADALTIPWSIPARSPDVTAETRWDRFLRALDEKGKALFVLDNVSEAAFLAANQLRMLPGHGRAAFLATTRMGCAPRPGELDVLDLDRLETADGIALLRRFRPESDSSADFDILRDIVEKVGGHALALEAIGVYLRNTPAVSLADYKAWFDAEPMPAIEVLGPDAENRTRHGEVLVGRLLAPTLERLAPLAMEAARTAAFLPPDAVYEPWLRALVMRDRPELTTRPNPGTPSAWEAALAALEGNLLVRFQDKTGRMHRIVGEVLRAGSPENRAANAEGWIGDRVRDLLDNPRDTDPAEIDAFEAWALAGAATTRPRTAESAWRGIYLGRVLAAWRRNASARRLFDAMLVDWAEAGDAEGSRFWSILLNEVGNVELALGLRDEALERYRQSLEIRQEVLNRFGRSPQALRDVTVSFIKVGDVELALGLRDEALARYRQSLEISREVLNRFGRSPEALRDVSVSLNKVGDVELALGLRDEALARYRQSLEIRQEVLNRFGRSPQALRDVSVSLDNVGNVELGLGLRDEALARYRQSLEISREVLNRFGRSPEALRDVTVSLNNVGNVELALGLRDEALARYRQSLEISREVLNRFGRSPQALRDVSVSLDNVGNVELALGIRDEALARYRQSLEIRREVLNRFGRSPQALRDVSVSLDNVGNVELALGIRDEALARYRQSLEISREVLNRFGRSPEALRDVSVSLNKVGNVELALGIRDEALARYRQSLEISREVLNRFGRSPQALRDVTVSLEKVGNVELALGLRDEALARYRQSLEIRQEVLNRFGRSPQALRDLAISHGRVTTSLARGDFERAGELASGLDLIESAIAEYGEWAQFIEVRDWLTSLE